MLKKEKTPLIGITTNCDTEDYSIRQKYCHQILEAGGTPVLLPPVSDISMLYPLLDITDAIIFSGGGDHNPLLWNEEPDRCLGTINPLRDSFEIPLCKEAYKRNMPILGICRGMQTIAISLHGGICQNICEGIKHSQDAPKDTVTHSVKLLRGSILHNIYQKEKIFVNSFHHQAVSSPGPHLCATALSADNVIEAIESSAYHNILGVQWHPEYLGTEGWKIFHWLVSEAEIYRKAKSIHKDIITIDSHCDTPMFFSQGVDFLHGDKKILYDLKKMDYGRIDAVTMVCYLPQPSEQQCFSEVSQYGMASPKEYADKIFDIIHSTCSGDDITVAENVATLYDNKRRGIHSIMLGIENGIALEHDIRNIEHFLRRGVRYITLCHNGDNDICDSARGSSTHNGLSSFGRDVVREMNRLNMVIDMSHASEKSFYDVISLSEKPIVCSHSNCRALCNHPRNITDDQMRTLAAHGGVMQLTLYPGFLKEDGEANIENFMLHLQHAIDIMGIDHVGIGTDFDGDGGIKGLSSASELMNITIWLIKKGFSYSEIEKIWGKNWLRILQQ